MSFKVVDKFEKEICKFYNAPYGIAVDSCTHGMELCLRYLEPKKVTFPVRTYISVPFLGHKLNLDWSWDDTEWADHYTLGHTNIVDAAVYWREGGYIENTFMCLSFQYQKHLSLGRGGMILTDDKEAASALKKLSYDGRDPLTPWRDQDIKSVGYHYYMTPETAQKGLDKLNDAKEREPRKWVITDWPDLRNMSIFKSAGL